MAPEQLEGKEAGADHVPANCFAHEIG